MRYWITWTYVANYSDRPIEVEAATPAEAITKACGFYSHDFASKATIYVWPCAPVLVQRNGLPVGGKS